MARRSFNHYVWKSFVKWALMSGGLSLGTTFVSVFLSKSPLTANRTLISLFQRMLLLLTALLVLEIIIDGVANIIKRRNREVIFLKQRLAEVYLSAIRKSALNPRLEPNTSND